jgi:hypothetical protein
VPYFPPLSNPTTIVNRLKTADQKVSDIGGVVQSNKILDFESTDSKANGKL